MRSAGLSAIPMAVHSTIAALGLRENDCVVGPPLDRKARVRTLSADSREVAPGAMFGAFQGVRAHGADYLGAAATRGAVAAVASPSGVLRAVEALGSLPIPVLVDPVPRRRFAMMASRFWSEMPATRVAVTGTNGKTSTVEFLRQIWRNCGLQECGIGTLGAFGPKGEESPGLTTPEPTVLHRLLQQFACDGATHAALEASSHALAQFRLDGVSPTIAALASFSRDHLDYHGSLDEYAEAKLRLFAELLTPNGVAVADADCALGRVALAVASARGAATIAVGHGDCAKDGIQILRLDSEPSGGQKVTITFSGERRTVLLSLAGDFQARNALLAAGCAMGAGLPVEKAFAALESLTPVRGRMELAVRIPSGGQAYVDYAHTPDALRTALRSARRLAAPDGQVLVVFGAGGERDVGKRGEMGEIAASLADQVVITDDNPRREDAARIREGIREGAPGAAVIGDRREAIRFALEAIRSGDVLLVAGKGHETVQETARGVVPFDDVATIRLLADDGDGN